MSNTTNIKVIRELYRGKESKFFFHFTKNFVMETTTTSIIIMTIVQSERTFSMKYFIVVYPVILRSHGPYFVSFNIRCVFCVKILFKDIPFDVRT